MSLSGPPGKYPPSGGRDQGGTHRDQRPKATTKQEKKHSPRPALGPTWGGDKDSGCVRKDPMGVCLSGRIGTSGWGLSHLFSVNVSVSMVFLLSFSL